MPSTPKPASPKDIWAGVETEEGVEWDCSTISGVWRCLLCGWSGVVVRPASMTRRNHRTATRLAGLQHYDSAHQVCQQCSNAVTPRPTTSDHPKMCYLHRFARGGLPPGGKKAAE